MLEGLETLFDFVCIIVSIPVLLCCRFQPLNHQMKIKIQSVIFIERMVRLLTFCHLDLDRTFFIYLHIMKNSNTFSHKTIQNPETMF